ncbi:MAG: fibronectin type III domain-containing protein [Turicibacter sp.]|nr:fibronectin type III domain-containing protein [Turicibacter sp.]
MSQEENIGNEITEVMYRALSGTNEVGNNSQGSNYVCEAPVKDFFDNLLLRDWLEEDMERSMDTNHWNKEIPNRIETNPLRSASEALQFIPLDLRQSQVTPTSVRLDWSSPENPQYLTGYELFRGGEKIAELPASTHSFTDTYLHPDTVYTYQVRSLLTGPSSEYVIGQTDIDATPPAPPILYPASNLREVSRQTNALSFAWDLSPTPGNLVDGYRIYRNGLYLTTVGNNISQFVDNGLPPGESFTYQVVAFNPYSQATSNGLTLQTLPEVIIPPVLAPPTGLTATGHTQNSVILNWVIPTSLNGIAGYRIFRNNNLIATTGTNTQSSFTDTGLSAGTAFTYRVASFNNLGSEDASSATLTTSTLQVPQVAPFAFVVNGEGGTRPSINVRNRSGSNVGGNWNIRVTYTGGNPALEWPASWVRGANGVATTRVNDPIPNNGSVTIPTSSSTNTRFLTVEVNGNPAIRE